MSRFDIGETDFLLDGQPFRVLSGALHYFRVHPDLWRDRIVKARQMGLNTIETYIAWNEHSPTPGTFLTDGGLDVARFLRIVQEEGMHAIVRPGPYICAEWDNGGLPAWLFQDAAVGIRRSEPRYLSHVTAFLESVYDIVQPLQISHGGPVILVQIENEYGAYGDDKSYLQQLVDISRRCGITVPLTTIDQPEPDMLENGSLPELHKTASFGSRSIDRLATLRAHQPTGPLMCAEFWDGWFDHWGAHHHVRSTAEAAADLDDLLSAGASVNIYMFHGGTNFGLTNGANDKGTYQPTVTSYDYDAPLDEAGNPTAKYAAFREVLAKYTDIPEDYPAAPPAAPQIDVPLQSAVRLAEVVDELGTWQHHESLPTLDAIAHYRGFAVYRRTLTGTDGGVLGFGDVRDRAAVFLDGRPVGVLSRDHRERSIALPSASGELVILLEDQGRVNYGARLGEHKGLIDGATLDGEALEGWDILPLDLDRVPNLGALQTQGSSAASVAGPAFARADFTLDAPTDMFLDTSGWGKGVAWVNGFCLGRYWRRGPQETLFVPAPVLRSGGNVLVIFELEAIPDPVARFVGELRLGHTDF